MLPEQSWPLAREVSEQQPAVGVRCGQGVLARRCGLVLGRPRVRSPAEKRPGREAKGSAAGGAVLPQRDGGWVGGWVMPGSQAGRGRLQRMLQQGRAEKRSCRPLARVLAKVVFTKTRVEEHLPGHLDPAGQACGSCEKPGCGALV